MTDIVCKTLPENHQDDARIVDQQEWHYSNGVTVIVVFYECRCVEALAVFSGYDYAPKIEDFLETFYYNKFVALRLMKENANSTGHHVGSLMYRLDQYGDTVKGDGIMEMWMEQEEEKDKLRRMSEALVRSTEITQQRIEKVKELMR